MFVLNPDPYCLPCYRIGPFQTKDIRLNQLLPESNSIDKYFHNRLANKHYEYTLNGREAIHLALRAYGLEKDDTVTILTTSGNTYISGCVTSEIEKYCQWSREIKDTTKLLFVNHEFGYPFENITELKKYNLPIIEDCASSFFSEDKEGGIGNVGDFVIYSFPKMFNLQIGGLLVCNDKSKKLKESDISEEEVGHVKKVLSSQIINKEKIIRDRLSNYQYLRNEFLKLGLKERFEINEGVVPGVFMFKATYLDLNSLKVYYNVHGVQCSVFYGENTFFIPVHQGLAKEDLDYFVTIMKSFLKLNKKESNA
ncbi:DegT/DnrJ/EryC1/StrS family aminotransferase [Carboxylicivirga sp. N1Y90]|uniref:DegT/DnrJ/EryC1/StrS family aminotransferase n=1 Tax=Carboxylicivirga fragile TaxID=3417571 RepID=UPI003D353A18|nr:DegT/DnrJ/EryC1/StrS aminotransferase family protein [Marinilabiliaceae bacterium N1Y90]